jgi:hypothetical protein
VNAEHPRDRSVDQLLRRSLAANSGAPVTAACLDADTLAAWVDGGLDARALELAETHAASCARCQALVAAMIRTAPEAAVRPPWWQRDWRVRWVVPLTATAAAVLLWTIVPEGPTPSPVSDRKAFQSRPAASPPPPPSPAAETAPPGRPPAQSSAEAKREAPESPPLSKQRDLSKRAAAEGQRTQAQSVDAPTPQRSAASAALDRRVANEAAPPAAVPVAPPPAADAAAAESLRVFGVASAVGAASSTREILSPDPAIRWRLSPGGSVHYSTDSGATWEFLSTGIQADLTAGSSPSGVVCWLVGRGGVVLRTVDGRSWQRVTFPEPVDLASVQATDAETAVVTASDGRTFHTADAGRTWTGGRR